MDKIEKPNARKVGEGLAFSDAKCIRAYIMAAVNVDIDYKKGPTDAKDNPIHIPYPADAIQHSYFMSKMFFEPEDNVEREDKRYAQATLKALRKRDMRGDPGAKDYLNEYVEKVEFRGMNIAGHIKDARKDLKDGETERGTWFGRSMQVGDIVLFRAGSGYGVYKLLTDTSFGDVEVEAFGQTAKLRDLALLLASGMFGATSAVSYAWKERKEAQRLKKMNQEIDTTYGLAVEDVVELLRRYYPETIVPIGKEEVLAERNERAVRKDLLKRYVKK